MEKSVCLIWLVQAVSEELVLRNDGGAVVLYDAMLRVQVVKISKGLYVVNSDFCQNALLVVIYKPETCNI